jgi:hypothetical protein
MDNIEIPTPLFNCELCKFKTHNKKDYKRHILTKKHNDKINDNISPKKSPISKIYECECKKVFKYASNLSRHKKNCNYKKEEVKDGGHDPQAPGCAQEINYKEIILTLLNQNKELQDLLIKQQEETNKKYENLILHINSNT